MSSSVSANFSYIADMKQSLLRIGQARDHHNAQTLKNLDQSEATRKEAARIAVGSEINRTETAAGAKGQLIDLLA